MSVIFDGLVIIANGEIGSGPTEGYILMTDGEVGSATFDGDHVVANGEGAPVTQPGAKISNGKTVSSVQSELSVTVAVISRAILSVSVEAIVARNGEIFDGIVYLVNNQPVIATPEDSSVVFD